MTTSLSDLAITAKHAHEQYQVAISDAVDHAMRCGEICWTVRERSRCEYPDWLRTAGISEADAEKYIAAWMGQAMQAMVADLEARRDRIRSMSAEGYSRKEIAELLDTSPTTVLEVLDPRQAIHARDKQRQRDHDRRHAKRANARRRQLDAEKRAAWEREQNRKDAAARGGSIAKAYSNVRASLDALQAALREESDAHAKYWIDDAMHGLYRAEDAIGKALKSSNRARTESAA